MIRQQMEKPHGHEIESIWKLVSITVCEEENKKIYWHADSCKENYSPIQFWILENYKSVKLSWVALTILSLHL